jgi:threonine aldolase
VVEALAQANAGDAPAYGGDAFTARAKAMLADYFERDVTAFFVATGSAANALCLSAFSRPAGVVFCAMDAHIARDEAGAPLLFAPGQSLHPVEGPAGRIDPAALSEALDYYPPGVVHHGQGAAVSLTNVNEFGQSYTPDQTAAVAEVAKARGCRVHLDGARFSNALAWTGAAPADLTWRAGVDAVSLGLTKTGGWCAEVAVFFDGAIAADAMYRHKQAAQLFSKNRFAAAQVTALLQDGHARDLAAHANAMGARLADAVDAAESAALVLRPQSNEVFVYLSPDASERLEAAGFPVRAWMPHTRRLPPPPDPSWTMARFVASFRSTEEEVSRFAAALAG